MKNKRNINGYVAIYVPDHPKAYTTENWMGYYYEHRYVIEQYMGRLLTDTEVVHHLDCDRQNNDVSNLIVLADRASHLKLHNWIDADTPIHELYKKKHVCNWGVVKNSCKMCNTIVNDYDNVYCSNKCRALDSRSTARPSKDELVTLLQNNSFVYVGKLFDVSDNAIRKWLNAYGVDPKTVKKRVDNPTHTLL